MKRETSFTIYHKGKVLLDTFLYFGKDELRNVFKDAGVMIFSFFFFLCLSYIRCFLFIIYIITKVVHEAKMVGGSNQSDSYFESVSITRTG